MRILICFFLILTPLDLVAHPTHLNVNPITNHFQNEFKVSYHSETLYFQGFTGRGLIEVYSIIGNKISETNVQDLYNFQYQISLSSGNMYIIRVTTSGKIFTYKIIAS